MDKELQINTIERIGSQIAILLALHKNDRLDADAAEQLRDLMSGTIKEMDKTEDMKLWM